MLGTQACRRTAAGGLCLDSAVKGKIGGGYQYLSGVVRIDAIVDFALGARLPR